MRIHRPHFARYAAIVATLLAAALVAIQPASAQPPVSAGSALSAQQRSVLLGVARDTWAFYSDDVDPTTHLPLDNLGPGKVRGTYTSSANIGVYLWAVVSAGDLNLISRSQEDALITATLTTVRKLKRSHGFLYQWYDTGNGHVIRNPGDIDCATETTPVQDNCYFLSAVDNGWYASGLVVARQALPELANLIHTLMAPIDFSIFYDNRAQIACNTNPAIAGNQPTGQMSRRLLRGPGTGRLPQRRDLQ